jgi:hypothetical protein
VKNAFTQSLYQFGGMKGWHICTPAGNDDNFDGLMLFGDFLGGFGVHKILLCC